MHPHEVDDLQHGNWAIPHPLHEDATHCGATHAPPEQREVDPEQLWHAAPPAPHAPDDVPPTH
jgi:hypothetical protein